MKLNRILACMVVILPILVGIISWHEKSQPKPVTLKNKPDGFWVVALTKNDEPVMLLHEISTGIKELVPPKTCPEDIKKVAKALDAPILWEENNRPDGPYSFYIDKAKKQHYQGYINRGIGNVGTTTTISILENNPSAHKQKIRIDRAAINMVFTSIYKVENSKITPLEYSSVTSRSQFDALGNAIQTFVVMLALMILLKIGSSVKRIVIRKKSLK